MKLLHVLPSVNPEGGGPIEGVRRRGAELLRRGHEVEVVTLDDPQAGFVPTYGLKVHALGPTKPGYGFNPRLVPWLREHAPGYDAVVVNGLWQYHAFGAWRALHGGRTPYFVFTHGMLDPWFKRTYPLKHLKKWLYWPWADYRVLRDARAVIFTCEQERLLARQSFWLYRAQEAVTSYGTATPPQDAERLRALFIDAHPALRGKRVLLFLSRIHEKKGCDLLIDAFARVASSDPNLHLVMAGPDQTAWVGSLKARAQAAGVAERVTWPGMLQGDMKWGAFHAAEAFVLPSHQENFGIVVAEALGCGTPVLISDQVNIWREVLADQAGLVAPDTLDGTVRLLQQWGALPAAERAAMRRQAAASFARRYTVEAMATGLLDIIASSNAASVAPLPPSRSSTAVE